MDRAQTQTHTMLLRHPNVLATAKAYLATIDRHAADMKILSFGCSIGDELASLKLLFPQARIFGCDTDEAVLDTARATVGGLAEVFHSSEAALRSRGRFDLICALSSLCVHPPPQGPMEHFFSFNQFATLVGLLAEILAPGGVLALYNASYLLQRTRSFATFTPIRSDVICRNGFVNIHDEAGEIIVEFGTSPTGTSVRGVRKSGAISDYELVDSLFALTGRPAGSLIALKLHDTGWAARAGYSLAFSWSRSELDGFPVKDRGRFMDMRRDFRVYVDSGGQDTLYDYDVSRMSLDGGAELKLATYGPLSVQISDRP